MPEWLDEGIGEKIADQEEQEELRAGLNSGSGPIVQFLSTTKGAGLSRADISRRSRNVAEARIPDMS
jgi:hypothetical protein